MQKEITLTEAAQIFATRRGDLEKFKDADLSQIKNYEERAGIELAQKTYQLNDRLFNAFKKYLQ